MSANKAEALNEFCENRSTCDGCPLEHSDYCEFEADWYNVEKAYYKIFGGNTMNENSTITITVSEYTELVKAQHELEIIKRNYKSGQSDYRIGDILAALLCGPDLPADREGE